MAKGAARNFIIETIKQQTEPFHPSKIAGLTGTSVPYVTNVILSLMSTGKLQEIKEGRKVFFKLIEGEELQDTQIGAKKTMSGRTSNDDVLRQFNVYERFDYVQKLAQMVIEKATPSLFLTGSSGIGKTYLVRDQLKRNGLAENTDFKYIKGHVSPLGLYTTLYYNQEGLIVFDDCDKVFETDISVSILEAALDSYDKRTIHWESRAIPLDSDIPRSFDFRGNVIFVSNRDIVDVASTLRTRTLCINLTLSRSEITQHMRNLLPMIESSVPIDIREEVMNYLGEIENEFKQYNLRTLIKAIRIRTRYEDPMIWKPLVKVVASNE